MDAGLRALVISLNDEIRENLASVLSEYGFAYVSVSDGNGVRSIVESNAFDLIILNTPLASEFGLELAAFIDKNTDSALIVAASQKNCDDIYKKIGSIGAYILARPFTKPALIQTVRFLLEARKKMLSLEAENKRLEKKLYDIKQIDRAKCVLIEYLRISEADAHRQIQKRAMDQRVPEIEIAMDILRTYEI